MHSRLNLYNYPKCLILLLLDVVSNIYKQHSYFPPNFLSSWCITTSPSTISELMFRSLPDPDEHLLKTAHCAMPLLEPSMHVRMKSELRGYSNLLWGPSNSCSYNAARSDENSRSCHIPCWLNCNYRTIKHSFFFFTWNDSFCRNCFSSFARLHISLY